MKTEGKKVGELTVWLKRDIGRDRAFVKKELRLDSSGTFHAYHDGKHYSSKTQADLAEQLRVVLDKAVDLVWERYIIVGYDAEARPTIADTGRPRQSGCYEHLTLDDDRGAKLQRKLRKEDDSPWVINAISLDWAIVEFTQPYSVPDKDCLVRSRRGVSFWMEDGERVERADHSTELDSDALPPGAVPWTAEREQLLRDVLVAMAKLDARLAELFGGDAKKLAGKLDALAGKSDRLLGP